MYATQTSLARFATLAQLDGQRDLKQQRPGLFETAYERVALQFVHEINVPEALVVYICVVMLVRY